VTNQSLPIDLCSYYANCNTDGRMSAVKRSLSFIQTVVHSEGINNFRSTFSTTRICKTNWDTLHNISRVIRVMWTPQWIKIKIHPVNCSIDTHYLIPPRSDKLLQKLKKQYIPIIDSLTYLCTACPVIVCWEHSNCVHHPLKQGTLTIRPNRSWGDQSPISYSRGTISIPGHSM
jgi:hypothetical protein